MKQGIILAAGLGSRLPEITKKTPKSLIRFNGKSVLEYNIEYMLKAGLDRVVLVVGYMKERFSFLSERFNGKIIIVENPDYATSNTISSMNCASRYFECDSFVSTADILLLGNPYEKYKRNYSFYLLRPYSRLEKADWIAELNNDKRIINVDKHAVEGHSYTGISFWKKKDLDLIRKKLLGIQWNNESQRKLYWDELLLEDLDTLELYAQILADDSEIYEFDDIKDVELFQRAENCKVEW